MSDRAKALVFGSFVADALALGVHWVYNTNVIHKKFGVVDAYHDPLTSYHTGKKKGDFTHYGDQMLVLLESVAACKGFDLDHFAGAWRTFFGEYQGYFDKATKTTMKNLEEGHGPRECGSPSDDLAGAARISPLVYACRLDLEKLVSAARLQTAFSHNNETVIDAAEFFARTALKVLGGSTPSRAVNDTIGESYSGRPLERHVALAADSIARDTREAVADFGQMCEIDAALPATLHLILKYEDDFKRAMVENVMAGGDSAARGMLAGMILAAHGGMAAIPEEWVSGLNLRERITAALANLRT